MANINKKINQLKKDKQVLIDNLIAREVEVVDDETFTTLCPKVSKIQGSSTVEEMELLDRTVMSLFPWRRFSEKDYTDEEVEKVRNLLSILGGN